MSEINFSDRLLQCVQCGTDFLWTAGQQRFFQERQLKTPRRCKECRENRPVRGWRTSYPIYRDR